jgi:hypothetical protein
VEVVSVTRTPMKTVKTKQARALQLLGRGYTYDEIADDLGYANRGSAWRLVRNALLANVTAEFEQYRTAEILRLDAIQDELMPLLSVGGPARGANGQAAEAEAPRGEWVKSNGP